MIEYDSIKKAMGVDIAISPKMAQAMYKWQHMYVNETPWLNKEVKSLNLPAAICTEMARLVTMESSVTINGSARADLIAESMRPFLNQLQNYTEYACSVGGIVFKPYIFNGKIAIDVTQAGSFYPVTFDSAGDITAAIFPEFKQSDKNLYVRLEYQAFDGDTYTIMNKAFVSQKMIVRMDDIVNLGQEISLEDVDEWADIEPYVQLQNATTPLFAYFRMPMANNTDPSSPLGVSVFSRAVDLIRDADEQYGATLWEYRSKETAIQAADEFYQKDRKGHIILPAGNKRLYRALGPGVSDKNGAPFFNVYSPEIRDQSFFNGYNRIVQKIEFNHIYFISVHIHPYEGRFCFAPQANYSDGRLAVCVAHSKGKGQLLGFLMGAMTRKLKKYKGVRHLECREIMIHLDRPLAVHADGESCCMQKDIQLRCIQKKLRVIG